MHYYDLHHHHTYPQPSYFRETSLFTHAHTYKMKMCVTWFNIYQIFPPLQIKHAHLCLCGVYLWSHLFASILNPTFSISKQDICWPQMWNLCLWLYTRINLHIIEIEQRKKTTVLSGRGLQISKQCLFAIWATAWKSCEYSTSTGRKGGWGVVGMCFDLWPPLHQQS